MLAVGGGETTAAGLVVRAVVSLVGGDVLERLAGGGELGRPRDKGGRRQRMEEVGELWMIDDR
jgi:hypothetical protein